MFGKSRQSGSRRNTLEIRGDQDVVSKDQLTQEMPELFDAEGRLGQIDDKLKSNIGWILKNFSKYDFEKQEELSRYLAGLSQQIVDILRGGMDFSIENISEQVVGAKEIHKEHKILVSVADIQGLLSSIKEPVHNLDTLMKLCNLLGHFNSRVEQIKGGMFNFEEHKRKNEINVAALEGELSDLLEQEKEGELNRSEQVQKDQLEDELKDAKEGVAHNVKKMKHKKRRIRTYNEKQRQLLGVLSDFLSQLSSGQIQSLPEGLDVSRFLKEEGVESMSSVSWAINQVLSQKEEGKYTTENIQAVRKLIMKAVRRRLLIAMIPVLGLAGVVGLRMMYGDAKPSDRGSVAGRLSPKEDLGRLMAGHKADMENNPDELTQDKDRLLKYMADLFTDEQKLTILVAAKNREDLVKLVFSYISFESKKLPSGELEIEMHSLAAEAVEQIYGPGSVVRLMRGSSVGVRVGQGNERVLTQRMDLEKFCKISPILSLSVSTPIPGTNRYQYFSHSIARHEIKEDYCFDSLEKGRKIRENTKRLKQEITDTQAEIDRMEEEIERNQLRPKMQTKLGFFSEEKYNMDLDIIKQLLDKNYHLIDLKNRTLEIYGSYLTEDQRQMVKSAKSLYELKIIAIERISPAFSGPIVRKDVGESEVKLELEPNLAEIFRAYFGKDVDVSFSVVGGDLPKGKGAEFVKEFQMAREDFCRSRTAVQIETRKPDSKGNLVSIYTDVVLEADFYQEQCPGKHFENWEELQKLQALRDEVGKHLLIRRYRPPFSYDEGDKASKHFYSGFYNHLTINTFEVFLSKWVDELAKSPKFNQDLDQILQSFRHLWAVGPTYLQNHDFIDPDKLYISVQLQLNLEEALREMFGAKNIKTQLASSSDAGINDVRTGHILFEPDQFCGANRPEFSLELTIKVTPNVSLKVTRALKSPDMSSRDIKRVCADHELDQNIGNMAEHPFLKRYMVDSARLKLDQYKTHEELKEQLPHVLTMNNSLKPELNKDLMAVIEKSQPHLIENERGKAELSFDLAEALRRKFGYGVDVGLMIIQDGTEHPMFGLQVADKKMLCGSDTEVILNVNIPIIGGQAPNLLIRVPLKIPVWLKIDNCSK